MGLALSAGVFLEAGPLHARGLATQATLAATQELTRLWDEVDAGRDQAFSRVSRQVTAAAARNERTRMLDAALGATDVEARLFLAKYPVDEARPGVNRRLAQLCAAKVPTPRFDAPRNRALRALLRVGCASADGFVRYTTTGDSKADVAQIFMKELTEKAAKLSVQYLFLETKPVDPIAASIAALQSATDIPRVRLAMRALGPEQNVGYAGRTQDWYFDAVVVDAFDAPVAGADYHAQGTVNFSTRTITLPGFN
jgi:hypothetical protein